MKTCPSSLYPVNSLKTWHQLFRTGTTIKQGISKFWMGTVEWTMKWTMKSNVAGGSAV